VNDGDFQQGQGGVRTAFRLLSEMRVKGDGGGWGDGRESRDPVWFQEVSLYVEKSKGERKRALT